jgi:hypothetical protein
MSRWAICVLFLFPISFAYAAEPPAGTAVIDMTTVLKNEHGTSVIDDQATQDDGITLCGEMKKGEDGIERRISLKGCPPLTLGHAVAHGLYQRYPDDQKLPDVEKLWAAQARLAEKIADDKQATLTAGNIKRIETLLGRQYGPLILSQTYALLDPTAVPPEYEVK